MFKEFFLRKMVERQLANVPKEEQERIMKAMMEHPELFTEIAQKIKEKSVPGKDQMAITMEVMGEYQERLKEILGPKQ